MDIKTSEKSQKTKNLKEIFQKNTASEPIISQKKTKPNSIVIGRDYKGNIIYKMGRFIVSSVYFSDEEIKVECE